MKMEGNYLFVKISELSIYQADWVSIGYVNPVNENGRELLICKRITYL